MPCRTTLDRLESAHYDCFPSGHTELTILAWWGSRMVSNRLFRVYFAYTPSSFLLQFIFDTTIRSMCWPGRSLALVLIAGRPRDVTGNFS